jgi:hypothetical protein
MTMARHAHALHRLGAVLLAPFLLLHLGNHLQALGGVERHIALMEALRPFYREPLLEGLLFAVLLLQAVSGLRQWRLAWRAEGRRRLQAMTGAVLLAFLVIHVGAVLVARHGLGLDTNFHFAAAGMHVAPFGVFFVPYYAIAVVALFTHLGCALAARLGTSAPRRARWALRIAIGAGVMVSAALVAAMLGIPGPYAPPPAYTAPFTAILPWVSH